MNKERIQLSLFIEKHQSEVIEEIRFRYNPLQYQLIKSHITLCRDDELEDITGVLNKLNQLQHEYLEIALGAVKRFADGKGVLIPTDGADSAFHQLRASVLQAVIDQPRIQRPHITLMHPRNSTCTDAIFQQIQKAPIPNKVLIREICLIKQAKGHPWRIVKSFPLKPV